jgi:hypothetical protein
VRIRFPPVLVATDEFGAHVRDLDGEHLVRLLVAEPRWLHPETNSTVHTPPPGERGVRYSGLVVVLQLLRGSTPLSASTASTPCSPRSSSSTTRLADTRGHGA